jgi:hypothetical protein
MIAKSTSAKKSVKSLIHIQTVNSLSTTFFQLADIHQQSLKNVQSPSIRYVNKHVVRGKIAKLISAKRFVGKTTSISVM